MSHQIGKFSGARFFAVCLTAFLILASSAGASDKQKNNKKNKDAAADQPAPALPSLPDTDQIERTIGEMLAALQLGETEMMHKYYSDNVTFVSGEYEPPIVGWKNYAAIYDRQKAAFQGMQLIRRNTLIITHSDVAWAMYQWELDSNVNGRPYSLRGQTTLILNKTGAEWLIVHNHTSGVFPQASPAAGQTPAPAATHP